MVDVNRRSGKSCRKTGFLANGALRPHRGRTRKKPSCRKILTLCKDLFPAPCPVRSRSARKGGPRGRRRAPQGMIPRPAHRSEGSFSRLSSQGTSRRIAALSRQAVPRLSRPPEERRPGRTALSPAAVQKAPLPVSRAARLRPVAKRRPPRPPHRLSASPPALSARFSLPHYVPATAPSPPSAKDSLLPQVKIRFSQRRRNKRFFSLSRPVFARRQARPFGLRASSSGRCRKRPPALSPRPFRNLS